MEVYNSKKNIISQVTQENGQYTIVTNGEDSFWNSDSITFLYEPFEYLYEERSSFEMEVTVQSLESAHRRASAGIMLRSAAVDDAANAFLLVRRAGFVLTWRSVKGSNTKFREYHCPDGIVLPCRLRLHAAGNVITAYYRYGEMNEWKRWTSAYVEFGTNPVAGIAAYSGDCSQTAEMVLSGLSMKAENLAPEEAEEKTIVRELSEDVLFLEDFEYGTLKSYPEGRYSWTRIRAANILPTTGADGKPTYAWYKDHMNGSHFSGSKHWADYAFSLKLRFDESCIEEESNTFAAFVRHREMDFYGTMHYGVYLTDGNTLSIRKLFTEQSPDKVLAVREFPYLQDKGTWHTLRIEAFDNRITVFWDGEEVLSYLDEALDLCPVGGIGFLTEDTSVWLDDLAVYELEDALGGAYDNLIGGLWDQPAPEDFEYDYEGGMHCIVPPKKLAAPSRKRGKKENETSGGDSCESGCTVGNPGNDSTQGAVRTKKSGSYRILYTGNTWQSAGDIVTLFGGDVGRAAAGIAIRRVEDKRSDTVSYIPGAGYDRLCDKEGYISWAKDAEAFAEGTEWGVDCPIVQKTAASIKFRLPEDAKEGIWAVCVTLTDGTKEMAYLNLPSIHFVQGDEGSRVTPGGSIRVSGEHICREGAPETVRLYLKNAEQEYLLEAVKTDPDHMAEFVLPEDARYGEYEVTIHNGYGDGRCYAVPKTITVGVNPRESWPLNVFNVKDYGAKGLGCRYNDTPGFIAALHAAEANGGGTVLIPRGTYMLTHPITVPERVFLKGCGIRKSKIIWFPYHWDTDELPDYMILLQGNAEVSGLDISGTRLGPLFVTRGKDNHNIYIHDCRVFLTPYNGSPTNAHPRGNGLEDYQAYGLVRRELDYWQRENGHITFKMEGVDNLRLYDNDIYIDMDSCGFRLSHCNNAYVARNRNNACLRTHGSQNVLIEECEATRTAIEGDNIYFAHNDLHDSNINNREIMTTDGGGFLEHSEQYYIRATASEYEYELPFPFGKDVLVHAQLLILEGPGEGQMRRIVANDGLGIC